ncbi:MAG: hypothetical protein HY355_04705 [Armatimonadetes bacterium]|nr:hypothetical protein [Armatimonadota bacterium]
MSAPARTGVTHYAWPDHLAVVWKATASVAAAAFGPAGWQIGVPERVLPGGPPDQAALSHLPLPGDLVDRLAALEFVTAGLHTDFVNLERFIQRLQAEGQGATVLVVGAGPAVLVVSDHTLTVVEPPAAHGHAVLSQASGWIVHLAGAVAPSKAAAAQTVAQVAAPVAFGRFPASARFVLSPGGDGRLPAQVAAKIAAQAGEQALRALPFLDGSHTLGEIASACGLNPDQVAGIIETLLAHKLALRYWSGARPQAGAPAPR